MKRLSIVNNLLRSRKAIKTFDKTNEDINEDILNDILECGRLTPSAFNSSPYRIVWLDRAALAGTDFVWGSNLENAYGLIILATEHYSNRNDILSSDAVFETQDINTVAGFFNRMLMAEWPNWTANQAYMALTSMLLAANNNGIASCPIEGLKIGSIKMHEYFAKNMLTPVVGMSLGKSTKLIDNFVKVRRNNIVKIQNS